MKPRFLVGYDLACDYEVGGQVYQVRYGCHLSNTRDDYVFDGVVPLIGTVKSRDRVHEFPPEKVVDLFGTGFVGARWTADFSRVEYDGIWLRPRAVWGGDTLFMPGHFERQDLDLVKWERGAWRARA